MIKNERKKKNKNYKNVFNEFQKNKNKNDLKFQVLFL